MPVEADQSLIGERNFRDEHDGLPPPRDDSLNNFDIYFCFAAPRDSVDEAHTSAAVRIRKDRIHDILLFSAQNKSVLFPSDVCHRITEM